jgi:hypothetical protein
MISLKNYLHCAIVGAIAMTVSQPIAASATTPPVASQTHSLSVGRYLGGAGTNQARGVGYAPNGDIVVGGNFTGAIDSASGDPGKLLLMRKEKFSSGGLQPPVLPIAIAIKLTVKPYLPMLVRICIY